MSRTIALDTELFYSKEVSVKPLGAWKYVRHPKADCYMISVSDGTDHWAGHPRDFNFSSLEGATLLSHNAAFDEEVYLAQVEKGLWPKINYTAWHCTADLSSYVCNRRSLAHAVQHLFDVSLSKDMRDWMKGRTWDDAVREGKAEELLQYARDDAAWCWRIWDKCGDQWPEWEREVSHLTRLQGRLGVHIHEERLNKAIKALERVVLRSLDTLPWIQADPEAAAASPKAIAQACRDAGIPPPPIKAHDADAAEEWEDTYSHLTPWLKGLKDLRKAKKMLASLQTMKRRLRDDGTMAFSLRYFGAHTGRWAGEAGINFQNFNRMPMFVSPDGRLIDDPAEVAKHYNVFKKSPEEVEVDVVDMRGMIYAPPGKYIASVDLSQIEPRVLNYLVGNHSLLRAIEGGLPIYEAHARETMGWKGGKLKKENEKLYALAKARVLGLGYGCGAEKFITVARMMAGIDITENDEAVALDMSMDKTIHRTDDKGNPCEPFIYVRDGSKRVKMKVHGAQSRLLVADFRANNPLIKGLWKQLQEHLQSSVGEDMKLELPSGRSLVYRAVTVERVKGKNPETGETYDKMNYRADVGGFRSSFYGGLLAENLVQAVARDVFAQNMLAMHKVGIRVLWSVHDEAVCLVDSPEEGEKARSMMATTPAWLAGCPVDSELTLSDRYKK